MPTISKPNDLSVIWASSGDVVKPTPTKIATGWEIEVPPRQWFNWLDNRQDSAIAHINQFGVAAWDGNTEYQGNFSLVMGRDGRVYKAKVTNAGQDPVLDTLNTYWVAVMGDVTEVSSDYTLLPGGVIMQWGQTSGTDASGLETIVFPKPLTVGVFSFTATHFGIDPAPIAEIVANRTLVSTQIKISDVNGETVAGRRASYIIIGV